MVKHSSACVPRCRVREFLDGIFDFQLSQSVHVCCSRDNLVPSFNRECVGGDAGLQCFADLEKTVAEIPAGLLLVDDCSSDHTVELARELGLTVIEHETNTGYGGNQKTCYGYALETDAEYIVMLHPDYQYDSRVNSVAVQILELGICDCVLGSRIRTRKEALAGGMPWYKYFANRGLTFIENIGFGQNLGDFHSGFRAYRREVLETIPFERNSDDFVFDSQFLAQVVHFGFKLGDVPVPVRYFEEASSINFRRSARYAILTLWVLFRFLLHHCRLKKYRLFAPRENAEVELSATIQKTASAAAETEPSNL